MYNHSVRTTRCCRRSKYIVTRRAEATGVRGMVWFPRVYN